MKLGQFIKILRDIKYNCGDLEVMTDENSSAEDNNLPFIIDENKNQIIFQIKLEKKCDEEK